jgi:hypothetical protein
MNMKEVILLGYHFYYLMHARCGCIWGVFQYIPIELGKHIAIAHYSNWVIVRLNFS